ncbi:MAG: hypothetical protein V3571_06065 [Pseudodesulfovibrio sp.]
MQYASPYKRPATREEYQRLMTRLDKWGKFRDAKQLAVFLADSFATYPWDALQVDSNAFFSNNEPAFADFFQTRRNVLIVGDSHANFTFGHLARQNAYDSDSLVISRLGASIVGFGRSRSTLGVFEKVERYVRVHEPAHIVFKFGQVDVDLGIYYRIVVKNQVLDFERFFSEAVAGYVERIRQLADHARLYVCGINPPCLFDQAAAAGYTAKVIAENIESDEQRRALTRRLGKILPSIEARTRISLLFNSLLRQAAEARSLPYFDFADHLLDPETGLLKERFRQADNHHIVFDEQDAAFITERLRALQR